MDPKKFWSQILNHNIKENNMIPLRDCNSYLKSIYDFPNAMDTILIVPTKEDVFSLDDIYSELRNFQMGKLRTLKATKLKYLKSKGLSLSLTYTSFAI